MGGTILLADDSLTIQKVVELTFSDTDFTVIAVSTGDELLQRLPSAKPDVIICDVIMPGRDGYDVCQQIKSNPATLQIPVVLLTGTFEPFDRDRALAAGCSEIISKPFEARKLVETVDRLVQHAHGARPAELPPPPVEGAIRPPTVERPAFAPPPMPEAPQPAPPTWPPPRYRPPPRKQRNPRSSPSSRGRSRWRMSPTRLTKSSTSRRADSPRWRRLAAKPRYSTWSRPTKGSTSTTKPSRRWCPKPERRSSRLWRSPFPGSPPWADRTWDAEVPETAEPPDDSWVERPGESVEPGATEMTDGAGEEPFGEPEGIILQPWQETPPVEEPSAPVAVPFSETAPPGQEPEPLPDDVTPSEPFPPEIVPDDGAPFHTMPMARLDELLEAAKALDEGAHAEEPPGPTGEAFDEARAHAPFEANEEPDEVAAEPFPAGVATAEPIPFAEEAAEAEAPASETRADTQPSVIVPPSTAQLRLSDEDVERVAKLVLELSRGLIEQIAWDVIPDMAEIVVRERVREIEAEADRESDRSTH